MLEEISESIKYGMSDVSSDECSFEQEEVANIYTHQEEKQVIVAFFYYLLMYLIYYFASPLIPWFLDLEENQM